MKRYYKAKSKSSPNLSSLTQEVGLPEVSTQHTHHHSHQPKSHSTGHHSDIIHRAHANLCCCCAPTLITCYDSARKCKNIQDIYEKLDKKQSSTIKKRSKDEPIRRGPDPNLKQRSKSMVNITSGNPILYQDLVPLGNINNLILQRFPDAYLFKRTKQCKPDCSGLNTKKIKVSEMAYEIRDIDEEQKISMNYVVSQDAKHEKAEDSNQVSTCSDEIVITPQIANGFEFIKKKKRKNLSERISDVLRKGRPPKKNQR